MSFASLSLPPVLEDALSNAFLKFIYFLIYIPEYCRLMLYKHYQKVALFGIICSYLLIKTYLYFFIYSTVLGKIMFGLYLYGVCFAVSNLMSAFSEWMKSYKANKILRSDPADFPMSKKNVYAILEQLTNSTAEGNPMTRQGFWWKAGKEVDSEQHLKSVHQGTGEIAEVIDDGDNNAAAKCD